MSPTPGVVGHARPRLRKEIRVFRDFAVLRRSVEYRLPEPAPRPGIPVLLVPGLYAPDAMMRPMARWLGRKGYLAVHSGTRSNSGCFEAESARLSRILEEAVRSTGKPATVVGWSRGGITARVLAVRHPDIVTGVVTLGSPLGGMHDVHPAIYGALAATYRLANAGVARVLSRDCVPPASFGMPGDATWGRRFMAKRYHPPADETPRCCSSFWRDATAPFPAEVGLASIYSPTDGVVPPQACLAAEAEMIAVNASHGGLPVSVEVFRALGRVITRWTSGG